MKRRAFLARLAPKSGRRVLPPYATAETDFSPCLNCSGPCVTACEEETGVLVRDAAGRPFLDFQRAGCTFCRACLDACPEGVLEGPERSPLAQVWIETGACLAHRGVVCVACKQACPEDAVTFEGMMRPRINEACTGCGLCVPACPVEAVAWSG